MRQGIIISPTLQQRGTKSQRHKQLAQGSTPRKPASPFKARQPGSGPPHHDSAFLIETLKHGLVGSCDLERKV